MWYPQQIVHRAYPTSQLSKNMQRWTSLLFFNILRPRQNCGHFSNDIFKCIFLNENAWISLKISLKFVPKLRINNTPLLVQIVAWHRPSDKPLSELMIIYWCIHTLQWKCHFNKICQKWQLPEQPVTEISWTWQHFHISELFIFYSRHYSLFLTQETDNLEGYLILSSLFVTLDDKTNQIFNNGSRYCLWQ